MCGIIGIASKSSRPEEKSCLERAVDSMAMRGPDDKGICSLYDHSSKTAGLWGHRRLSILDISSAGHQPMSIDDGKITIVHNGEIYNYRQLRQELQQLGCSFHSNCDTEVLLYAYKHWGKNFVKKCNGMFAFSIWDQHKKQIILYRDRIGIKPLYYGLQNGKFYFSSVLSALTEIDGFQKELDNEAIYSYVWIGYVPNPYSMFKGIKKLAPGSIAVLDMETWGLNIESYWDVTEKYINNINAENHKIDDCVNRLDNLLTESVETRLISDVPLGAFLSGGIDSSAIVAIMQKVHNEKVKTFSIGFDVEGFNEANHARTMADYLGTDHTEKILTAEDARSIIEEIPEIHDEPFSDSSCFASILLSRMTRKHVTVALSGDGGDELFLGDYYHYRLARYWNCISKIPYYLRCPIGHVAGLMQNKYTSRISESLKMADFGQYHYSTQRVWKSTLYPNLINGNADAVMEKLPVFKHASTLMKYKADARVATSILDFYSLLPDDFLVKVDRASMSCGLEVRVPMLDHKVVEFAKSLPLEIVLHQNNPKFLIKKLLSKYVPAEIWDRPKQGFDVPLAIWFRNDLYEFLYDNLLNTAYLSENLFDKKCVARILNDHKIGKRNNYRILWDLLSLVLWIKKYMKV